MIENLEAGLIKKRIHINMKKSYLLLVLSFLSFSLFAQPPLLKNYDHTYKENIKTVKFHLDGAFLSYPIINLNSNSRLVLSFDDINEDVTDYVYSISHCNKDWTPSELDEMDYLDGFNGERIDEYDFSFNTIFEYTHYEIAIPNDDIQWLVSGNYILNIFEDDEDQDPVLTRRFMVTESLMRTIPDMVTPSKVSKNRTHQEVDFKVNFKGIDIKNAQRDVTAVVLQNGRWDNAVTGLKPVFTKQEEMIFDYQDKVIFPAGKEFRFVDIRSLRYLREGIADIIREDNYFDVVVKQGLSRANDNFNAYNDINGNFIIEHLEKNRPDLQGDYAKVLFAAGVSQEYFDTDVYVFGALSEWQLKEEFKMKFNPAISSYVTQAFLKQGFYNYYFVTIPEGEKEISLEEFEGNWHQVENNYTVLIYYRPFGERYDRLVSVKTISSNDQ